jgi:hypothetical protein
MVWSRAKMELAIRRFIARHAQAPYWKECLQVHGLPPRPTLCREYGSLAAAIHAAGGEPPPKRQPTKHAA